MSERLKEAERLEKRAAQLRDQERKAKERALPKKGDLVYVEQPIWARGDVGTITHVWPSLLEVAIDFKDRPTTCSECGQRTGYLSTRGNPDRMGLRRVGTQ